MPPIHTNMPNGDLSHIAADLRHLATLVTTLKYDPYNARLHPQDNLDGIEQSLVQFGQCQPIVVNRATGMVCAGNGRLEVAIKRLKWTHIAVVMVDWDEDTTNAYALADNTTSDSAVWDMEAKARLVRLIERAGNKPICISDQDLMIMHTLEYIPPPTAEDEDTDDTDTPDGPFLSESSKEAMAEAMIVDRAIELCRKLEGNDTLSKSQALYIISYWYLNQKSRGDSVPTPGIEQGGVKPSDPIRIGPPYDGD